MKRIFVVVLLFAVVLAGFAQTVSVSTDFQDTQPKFIQNDDGSFTGLVPELIRIIEENTDYRFVHPPNFVPAPRILQNLEAGATQVHVGYARTEARMQTLIFTEPLYDISTVLLSRADDPVAITTVEQIRELDQDGVVLSLSGVATNVLLNDLGFIVDDGARDIAANLAKLAANRGRFFAYHNLGLVYSLEQRPDGDQFKFQPIRLQTYQHWLAFAQNTPQSVIDGISQAVRDLRDTPEWQAVIQTYLGN